ncbi:uncharacterized protein [Rutidosis leptorrhynchoides]|uniref:uncharacterized protein n=1 Tax=Rutidosis leptorrhynchoides TaxID=125765 RepID=UPI003A9912EC
MEKASPFTAFIHRFSKQIISNRSGKFCFCCSAWIFLCWFFPLTQIVSLGVEILLAFFRWAQLARPLELFQFHLWLIAKNRLPTQVSLLSYGRIDHALCAFCNVTPDSIDHLFFDCHVSATIAYFWASRCHIPWRNRPWVNNLAWAMKLLLGKDFYYSIARFSFGAIYHLIWKKRNSLIFRGEMLEISAMKNHIIKVVRENTLTFTNVLDNTRNMRLQRSWGLDPSIFSNALSA